MPRMCYNTSAEVSDRLAEEKSHLNYNWVREAAHTLNPRKRMALYHELDRQLVLEEALCIPLAYNRFVIAAHPRVQLNSISSATSTFNVHTIVIRNQM